MGRGDYIQPRRQSAVRPQSSRVRYDDADYSSTYYGRSSARVRVSSEHPARTQSASRPARPQTTRTQAARPQGSRKKKGGGSRYVASIDGLRAFAVLAVIFYHMGLGWAPGGLMGVTVFFVISGYLINGLLGSLTVLLLCKALCKVIKAHLLQRIGGASLGIMCIH